MKYWDKERIRRERERKERRENRAAAHAAEQARRSLTYTKGDSEKNCNLMLDALGSALRRRLLQRLQREGAMSLSKLARAFGMGLTRAYGQMLILERTGLITTHKRGRIRICVFNRDALRELSNWLKAEV